MNLSRSKFIFFLSLISITISNVYAKNDKSNDELIIKKDFNHDISLPLRDLPANNDQLSIQTNFFKKTRSLIDILSRKNKTVPLIAFDAIGLNLNHYKVTQPQPDLNLAVGAYQYMQYANPDIAVFDKTNGVIFPSFPKKASSFWSGLGGICETNATGRLSIKYDEMANRWIVGQLAIKDKQNGSYFYCLAVSTSDDATGSYYRYAFQGDGFGPSLSLAIWPDGYYLGLDNSSIGPLMCAFERDKMLKGFSATMICKQLPQEQSKLLIPASLAGSGLPPKETPAYFLALNSTESVSFYKFKVSFDKPYDTKISSMDVPVNPYRPACENTNGFSCAEQPNTPNKLDVDTSKLLSSIMFREFSKGYGSIVATHVIEGPKPAAAPALRWYEFRVQDNAINHNPYLYQQDTIAPDSKNRYAASINIDSIGNIALGYTVSSSKIYPSAEFAWYPARDPLHKMKIQALITGSGSQINGVSQWTNGSKLVSDTFNLCMLYYTSEYLDSDGYLNWNTSVVQIILPCTSR